MTHKAQVSTVVAIGEKDRSIGNGNRLLWHIPDDLKRFKRITEGHPVIMGRKTYESLPEQYRPLPNRTNIIVTRQAGYRTPDGVYTTNSIEEALELAHTLDNEHIFIGGGQQIYEQALPYIEKLYLTIIHSDKSGDTFFPEYKDVFTKETFREEREYEGLKYTWVDLERA